MDARTLYAMADALGRAAELIAPDDVRARWFLQRLDALAEEAEFAARALADEEDEALRRQFAKLQKVSAASEAAEVSGQGGEPRTDARQA